MTRIAGEMLADIDSDTVDFVPNYDESTTEPTVLPARIPNLIVNGSTGIAVGMATNIPPHNLTEVLNATIALIHKEKGEAEVRPRDRPRARQGSRLPHRRLPLRPRPASAAPTRPAAAASSCAPSARIENISGGRQAIIVTEIPYQVNKSNLIKRIAELVNEKIIDDISDVPRRVRPRRHAHRHRAQARRRARRSSSTSSTSTPRCRRASP